MPRHRRIDDDEMTPPTPPAEAESAAVNPNAPAELDAVARALVDGAHPGAPATEPTEIFVSLTRRRADGTCETIIPRMPYTDYDEAAIQRNCGPGQYTAILRSAGRNRKIHLFTIGGVGGGVGGVGGVAPWAIPATAPASPPATAESALVTLCGQMMQMLIAQAHAPRGESDGLSKGDLLRLLLERSSPAASFADQYRLMRTIARESRESAPAAAADDPLADILGRLLQGFAAARTQQPQQPQQPQSAPTTQAPPAGENIGGGGTVDLSGIPAEVRSLVETAISWTMFGAARQTAPNIIGELICDEIESRGMLLGPTGAHALLGATEPGTLAAAMAGLRPEIPREYLDHIERELRRVIIIEATDASHADPYPVAHDAPTSWTGNELHARPATPASAAPTPPPAPQTPPTPAAPAPTPAPKRKRGAA